MNQTLLFLLSAAVCVSAQTSDPALKWTLYAGYQPVVVGSTTVIQPCNPATAGCIRSAIAGDNNGDYISGQSGVQNAVIHFSSGTYDATLSTGTRRTVAFQLGTRLAVNNATPQPSWATQLVTGQGFLNVSSILYPTASIGSAVENDYTTRLTTALPDSTYHLRMSSSNPLPDASAPGYYGTFNYNDPSQTALVRVHHCPDTTLGYSSAWCPAGHKESWYAYPDPGPQGPGNSFNLTPTGVSPTQVSMLVLEKTVKGKSTTTAIGQYSIPFFFLIELK